MREDERILETSYGRVTSFTLGKKAWENEFKGVSFPTEASGWISASNILVSKITGFPTSQIISLNQNHGREIVFFQGGANPFKRIPDPPEIKDPIPATFTGEEGDGLVTFEKKIALVVRSADCVPIFVYSKNNPMVAVLHSGWKGTLSGIAEKLIFWLLAEGFPENDLHVLFGPAIARNNYEVQWGLAKEFLSMPPGVVQESPTGGYLLGLREAISVRLRRRFKSLNIDPHSFNNYVTHEFYSHRANEKGRNFNVIFWES